MVEILVALGLTAAVTLGGAQLLKNVGKDKKNVTVRNELHNMHKLFQAQLLTEKGCNGIKGKAPGSEFELEGSGGKFHGAGKILGVVKIESLRFDKFTPSSAGSPNGLAEIGIALADKDAAANNQPMVDKRKVILSVNLKNGVVEDCKLNYSKAYAEMMDRICGKTWGPLTEGMTCQQAIALVEARIIEEICRDAYGTGNFQIINGQCNLKLIHANKACGQPGGITGFGATSAVTCAQVITN